MCKFAFWMIGILLVSCSGVEKQAWVQVTSSNVDSLLQVKDKLVVLEFSASQDGWCQKSDSIVFKVARDYRDSVLVGRVDVAAFRVVADRFGITSIPALRLLKDGKVKRATVGVLAEEEIRYLIGQVNGRADQVVEVSSIVHSGVK